MKIKINSKDIEALKNCGYGPPLREAIKKHLPILEGKAPTIRDNYGKIKIEYEDCCIEVLMEQAYKNFCISVIKRGHHFNRLKMHYPQAHIVDVLSPFEFELPIEDFLKNTEAKIKKKKAEDRAWLEQFKKKKKEANLVLLQRKANSQSQKEIEIRNKKMNKKMDEFENEICYFSTEKFPVCFSTLKKNKDFSFKFFDEINSDFEKGEWKISIFHKNKFVCSLGYYYIGNSGGDWGDYISFDEEQNRQHELNSYNWREDALEMIKNKLKEKNIKV